MSSVFLRRLSRWQAETEREQIGDLYAEAHQDVPGVRALSREEFVRAFVDHDLGQPGFDMVVASDPKLVGCAYGFQVSDVPLGIAELAAGGHVFRVAGLMVTPGGSGRRWRRGPRRSCWRAPAHHSAWPCWSRATPRPARPSSPGAGSRRANSPPTTAPPPGGMGTAASLTPGRGV